MIATPTRDAGLARDPASIAPQADFVWHVVGTRYYERSTYVEISGGAIQAMYLGTCRAVCVDLGLVAHRRELLVSGEDAAVAIRSVAMVPRREPSHATVRGEHRGIRLARLTVVSCVLAAAVAACDGSPSPGDSLPDSAIYRTSLGACWTDAACARVMAIGHGGAWDPDTMPYDSNAALANAFGVDMDGVKIDVRITVDAIPVIAHSSPILVYESLDCQGQKIEEMTAAQVTSCHRFPSETETFQRLDDVLAWLRGRMVAQLTVKLSSDYARTIAAVHAAGAEDYAFFEISTSELQTLIPTINGADTVWYLINIGTNLADVDATLAVNNPRAFMYEIDPAVQVGTLVTTTLHPAGVRAFTYDNAATASVAELQALYDQGFDVVSSQQGENGVAARRIANQARGITPP